MWEINKQLKAVINYVLKMVTNTPVVNTTVNAFVISITEHMEKLMILNVIPLVVLITVKNVEELGEILYMMYPI